MTSIAIIVSGRVQGVFYRASTKEKAIELDIRGWVKNLSNGNVFIHAEGNQNELDLLIQWCRQGPKFSSVKSVVVKEAQFEDSKQFEVRY